MELDPKGLAAARRHALWYIGDEAWADQILEAYFNPQEAFERLDAEQED